MGSLYTLLIIFLRTVRHYKMKTSQTALTLPPLPQRLTRVGLTDSSQPCHFSSEWYHHGDGVCWMVDEAVNHPTILFLCLSGYCSIGKIVF
jgi:hypothetical protein